MQRQRKLMQYRCPECDHVIPSAQLPIAVKGLYILCPKCDRKIVPSCTSEEV